MMHRFRGPLLASSRPPSPVAVKGRPFEQFQMSSAGNGMGSPYQADPKQGGPSSVTSGAMAQTTGAMARIGTPQQDSNDLTISRAESARRVLEARRKKQTQKNDDPSGSSATPGMGTQGIPESTTPTSSGVSQMLGGRLLQGIHDILMVMDEKVENLVTDVNNMRADFQGLPQEGATERKLSEIQSRVDIGFATIFSQLKYYHAHPRPEGDISPDGMVAHVPGSRQVELIAPVMGTPEGVRHRVSSSVASSSVRERSDVHELWEEMEAMENMGTEDLIACETQDGAAPPPLVTKPPPSRSSRESAGGPPLETSQERLSTHEEALTKVMSALSSKQSSKRNSRASNGNSASRISRNSANGSSSKEKVTFEDREERGSHRWKNGASSKSRVDEFKDFIKPRQRSSAQKLVWNFLEDPDLVRGGRSYGNILFFAIILSAVLPIVPTPIEQDWFLKPMMYVLLSLDSLFFLEVIFRFYGAPHRLRFFGSIHNWLDILSVLLPVALKIRLQSLNLAADAHPEVEGVELGLLVMVPVLRLLKLLRRFENSHLIKQAFREAVGALPSLLYCMMVLVVGFSAIIYVLEPRGNVETMPRAIWFTMVTLTTVGYGDVVPVSPGGNIVVCVLMIVSAMYMAMPLGIVGKAFGSVWDDRHRLLLMQRLRTRFSTVGYDPQDIPGLFCSYDENGDGELSMEEFRQMLQQLEVEAKDERAHDVFAAFDNDGSGAIDDSEFIKTLFPTAYKSMYKEPEKIDEGPEGTENVDG